MEQWKWTVVASVLAAIGGVMVGAVLNTHTEYISDVTIDSYGAINSSAKWEYSFFLNPLDKDWHWAFCNMDVRNIEKPFDLRNYDAFKFYIKGNKENLKPIFTIFTQERNGDNLRIYQYTDNGEKIRPNANWQIVTVNFKDLKLPNWEKLNEAPRNATLSKVFAFGLSAQGRSEDNGIIWIDEFKLINHTNNSEFLLSNFSTLYADMVKNDGEINGIWHSGVGSEPILKV